MLALLQKWRGHIATLVEPGVSRKRATSGYHSYFQQLFNFISNVSQGQHVNHNWMIMWEIASALPIAEHIKTLLAKDGNLSVFFNAELPGSFIFALYHYVHVIHQKNINWVASSLFTNPAENLVAPTDQTMSGRRLGDHPTDLYGLMQRYPAQLLVGEKVLYHEEKKKEYQVELSGDMTKINHCIMAANLANSFFQQSQYALCNVYTADGTPFVSVDGGNIDPKIYGPDAELSFLPLLTGEVYTCLKVLQDNGMAIIKIYSFITVATQILLAILRRSFPKDHFIIFKPFSSDPLSSERYVVAWGYQKDIGQEYLDLLDPAAVLTQFEFSPEEQEYFQQQINLFLGKQIKNITLFWQETPETPIDYLTAAELTRFTDKTKNLGQPLDTPL